MNQVYFYTAKVFAGYVDELIGLNPFMNQVYFYHVPKHQGGDKEKSLNPFMNQVYFYGGMAADDKGNPMIVLIPL